MAGWSLVRVALLSDCYLPRLGGIEVQVHDLAHRLVAAGHEVEVVTATAGETRTRTRETAGGVTVHRLPLPVPGAPPVNPFATGEVRELLRVGGFDVAHAHMGVVSPFATDLVDVALAGGVPTAVTWHCVLDRSAPLFRALGHARRWNRRGAALSAVSSMAAVRVASVADGADGADVRVLGNGIDVPAWRPGSGVVRADDDVVRVVSALRFVRRKRPGALVDVLLAARERLDRTRPGVRLEAHLVGDGPQRRFVAAGLRRRGADWVHLPGRVTREQLRHLHERSDVYLTTARLEAFGIAALEARTAGLAVLARTGTGVEDFVTDGREGLLRGSDDALAVALADLAGDGERLTGIALAQPRGPTRPVVGAGGRGDDRGVRPRPATRGARLVIEVVAMMRGRWADAFALEHGADPEAELARRGWSGSPVSVTRSSPEDLRITYAVRPVRAVPGTDTSAAVARDDGLGADEVASAVPYQRVAAYAVVRSSRGHPPDRALGAHERRRDVEPAGRRARPGGGARGGRRPRGARGDRPAGERRPAAHRADPALGGDGRRADGWRTSMPCACSTPPTAPSRGTRWCWTWAARPRPPGG